MSTTLPHGIIQINEGNISWYGDITANWQLIDSKIGVYDAAIATIPAPANNGTLTINYGGTTIAMFGADDAQNVTADIPAPGDGTLTVTQGGSTLGSFSANQATPKTIDIPAPGDGTLTIQLNGVDVQTFTANQSGNATANIVTPAINNGTLTIRLNGVDVQTFTANQANDVVADIISPVPGDGTLTIKVNGATAGTFTANQSTNATANITVPTKTSDLTNDSGFITEDNTKIPLAGSNAISGSLIPSTDNSIDIGSSTKNIKALYTKGITIDGTQFLPSDYLPKTTALESLASNSIPFHNSYPRCKYLGASITDAQNTAIKNRTYDDLFIGDYWTINGVNWRIVAIDYYYNVGDTNFGKGNVVVMPDTVLYNAQMNTENTTAGAYYGSLMRTQNLNSARTIAQNAFGSHLANHRIILANAVDASGPSGWGWYDSDGVELPNEVQVYGTRVWGSALKGFDIGTQKQQFPLMMLAPQFVNTRQTYWLQGVSSASVSRDFAYVGSDGSAATTGASLSFGVRPSFTLSYI